MLRGTAVQARGCFQATALPEVLSPAGQQAACLANNWVLPDWPKPPSPCAPGVWLNPRAVTDALGNNCVQPVC